MSQTPPPGLVRPGAAELVRVVTDPGSWEQWEGTLSDGASAGQQSGIADEAVVTGCARIGGRPVALLVSEFGFLGGSVGITAAGRLARGIETATRRRLPLFALPASGGTRMQDGTLAFLRMVDIARLLTAHRAAGLAYIVYLRNPVTGGVLASWGSLGQLTFAEPGALVGFVGPRVHELMRPGALPRSAQQAESLAAHGIVDQVLPPVELRRVVTELLAVLAPPVPAGPVAPMAASVRSAAADRVGASGWECIVHSRNPARPRPRGLLATIAERRVDLSGTGTGEASPAMLLALARIGGQPCVVVAHDPDRGPLPGPGDLRSARRMMRLAAELRLPLLTIIDAAGSELSPRAEEGGLAAEIARCLADLMTHPSPTVSVLLGQGGGGAALALLPADRTIAAGHSWLAPLPPEGGSALVYRDLTHAPDIADAQRVAGRDLLAAGAVDRLVDEPTDAADDPGAFLRRLDDAVMSELAAVTSMDAAARLAARRTRYADLGAADPAPDHMRNPVRIARD